MLGEPRKEFAALVFGPIVGHALPEQRRFNNSQHWIYYTSLTYSRQAVGQVVADGIFRGNRVAHAFSPDPERGAIERLISRTRGMREAYVQRAKT